MISVVCHAMPCAVIYISKHTCLEHYVLLCAEDDTRTTVTGDSGVDSGAFGFGATKSCDIYR